MASAGRVQTLLTCAKAQERRAMLPDGFSVGCFRLGMRLGLVIDSIASGTGLETSHASAFLQYFKIGRQSFHPIPCGSRDRPVGRKVIDEGKIMC